MFANSLASPLESKDIADAAIYMLKQPLHISVKAMDVVPTGKKGSDLLMVNPMVAHTFYSAAQPDDVRSPVASA